MSTGQHERDAVSPALVEAAAGLSAGAVATLVVHPLDLIKTRMQSEFAALRHARHPWTRTPRMIAHEVH